MIEFEIRWVKTLACALALTVPAMVLAQSADLLRAYQNFETAKAANKVPEALKYGNEAVKLTEDGGDKQSVIELLRNLGDFAAQAGQDQPAAEYYTRALAAQESVLGPDHPDLVPALTALADLKLKDKRYAEAAALEQRILDIERQAYGEHHENVLATLNKLREIYRAGGDAAGVTRIDGEVRAWSPPSALPPPPPAGERGLPGIPGGIAGADRRYRQNQQGFATVRVFYGTNRAPTGDVKPALFYGKERGELQYGSLNVTIPRIHKEAELETQPRWAEYTFVMNEASMRRRYVLLDQITPLAKDDFARALRQQIKDSPSKDLFIFVHGFNNTFEDAARRAAQMAYDLDFDGTPILYSWPSQGSVVAYAADEAAVGISGRKMADFLETVVAQSGAQRIHVLAHSMGNRALIEALQTYLAKRAPDKRQHIFGQIVFTAPDVALHYSQFVHGAPRAGTAGDVIVKLAGLDTIDMSTVPADILGHSYFAANSGAINDIFRIFWRGDAPPQRCGMKDRKGGGTLTVWWFNADACMGDDLLEAGVMLKRFGDLARDRVAANISALTDPSQKREWQLILNRLNGLLTTAAAAPGGTAK